MNQSKIIFIIILSVVFGMPIKTTYANIKSIRYYSGNAMGGWSQDIFITPNAINKITHKGNARSGGISTKFKEMSISYDKWQSIINKIDINKFHSLPKKINCEYMPVYCIRSDGSIDADGDGISITIDDGIKIKRVEFAKSNVRIPDFDPFLKQMNEINLEMESVKFTDIKEANIMMMFSSIFVNIGIDETIYITPEEISYSYHYPNGNRYSFANITIPTHSDRWGNLINKIDLGTFNALPRKIVCDSCVDDKKSVWSMSIHQRTSSKIVDFWYGKAPDLDMIAKEIKIIVGELKKNNS